MKKSVFLLIFLLGIIFGFIVLIPKIKENTFVSSKFETIMEMKKNYQFVKILDISNSDEFMFVDCYGEPLEKFQWYVYCKNGRSFCPTNNDFYESDYENADIPGEYSAFKANGTVKSDTVQIYSCLCYDKDGMSHYENLTVKLLVFGKRIIYAGYNGENLTYWLTIPRERNERTEE